MMERRAFLALATGGLLAAPLAAEGQQAGKLSRIGVLGRPGAADTPHGRAFRERLRELGWVEGQTVTIDGRWTGGEIDELDAAATQLVRAGVDVLVTPSTPAVLAAKRATQTIPIVMTGMNYPVEKGAVASLAHPGGNVTGVSSTQAAASDLLITS